MEIIKKRLALRYKIVHLNFYSILNNICGGQNDRAS